MKKVGILTYHRSINYGAFMQSYSLATALKQSLNCDVEIIDYNLKKVHNFYLRKTFLKKDIKNIIKRVGNYNSFRKSISTILPLSREKLITDDMDKAFKFLRNKYDAIVVGSDEVWKIDSLRGFPNLYFLHDELDCKKISYAASANQTNYSKLTSFEKEYISQALNSFSYIGVRDNTTINHLKELNRELEINRNCDPTFMYEIQYNDKFLEKLKNTFNIDEKKPILGLMVQDENIGKYVRERYGDKYTIISIYNANKYADIFINDLNPLEWAQVFKIFDFCITTYFHGTIFSIKNNIPFISIDLSPFTEEYDTKLKDLLKNTGLIDYYFTKKQLMIDGWAKVYEAIDTFNNATLQVRFEEAIKGQKKYYYDFVDTIKGLLKI